MKLRIYLLGMLAATLIFLAGCGPSAVVVRTRPQPPVYVRPMAPGPGYIWVEGDWIRRGRYYNYRKGHWVAQSPRYRQYKPGRWQQRRSGWYWIPGRWN
ncbi:MAG: hypothetical protein ABIO76_10770 [Ginsengibacter sp.]